MTRFLLAAALAIAPLAAFAQEAPDALVKRVSAEVLEVIRADKALQAGDPQKVVQVAEAKVLPHFDFARMTRLAMGRNWTKADPGQRERLVKEFRTLLVKTYSNSLATYRDQTIEVKPVKMAPQDEDTTVRTAVIQPGGPPIPVDYSMQKTPTGWKVYDIVVDGVSLVTTYRGSFNDQVQRGGVDGLLATLEQRNRSPEPPAPPGKEAARK